MKVYEPAATTNPETIERYGQLAIGGDTAEVAARG